MKSEFRITRHAGFQMDFANGYGISVQFNRGNYCEHYNSNDYEAAKQTDCWKSYDAEIAILSPTGLVEQEIWGDTVRGRVRTDEVAAIIAQVMLFDKDNNQLKEVL